MNKIDFAFTQISRFTTLKNALSFRDRSPQRLVIVLGDETQYWVASPRWASVLVKAGYEYLEL